MSTRQHAAATVHLSLAICLARCAAGRRLHSPSTSILKERDAAALWLPLEEEQGDSTFPKPLPVSHSLTPG
jgi:hypothetical protein